MEPEIDYDDYEYDDDNEINTNLDINKNPSEYSNDYEIEEDYNTNVNHNVDPNGVVLLKEDQLMSERDHTINEAMETLGMSRDDAILALIFFNWSYEKLSENWFNDVEGNKVKSGICLLCLKRNLRVKA